MDNKTEEIIRRLGEKYQAMGQDMDAYLDGLLLSNYTNYWEYTRVDTLLTLQQPKTDFPDELIFIMYHQITELYFRLVLHEIDQIAHNGRLMGEDGHNKGWKDKLDVQFFADRVGRINCYFEALTKSFDIMVEGMEREQFLRFRMALLPASGFQSAQYRKIEICSTDMYYLVQKDQRYLFDANGGSDMDEMFAHIYWKQGATELSSGAKTLTLKQFENKYSEELVELAHQYRNKNLWQKYKGLSVEEKQNEVLKRELRMLDVNVNINWPLVHYKSAVRYLHQDLKEIAATGGTNWQKYLPPRFQKRIFYPQLWSEQEMEEWGKGWVEELTATTIKTKKDT